MAQIAEHDGLSQVKNNTRTLREIPEFVTVDRDTNNVRLRNRERCAFIVAEPSGSGVRQTCAAPAVARSPYCARHRALCRVAPGTEAAVRIAQAQVHAADGTAPPPPHLAACAVPEALDPADPDDALLALDRRPEGDEKSW